MQITIIVIINSLIVYAIANFPLKSFCAKHGAEWYVILYAIFAEMGLGHRGKDVDHRNLISLTGSPAAENTNPPPTTTKDPPWNSQSDQVKHVIPTM